MIPEDTFKATWRRLCQRWGRRVDAEEARFYHTWLSERMGVEDFQAAAEHLWATREFFPPPAAFLVPTAHRAFQQALKVAAETAYGTDEEISAELREAEAQLSPPARQALLAMGGRAALYRAALEDPGRARKVWLEQYEFAATGLGGDRPWIGLGSKSPRRAITEPRGGGLTPVGQLTREASPSLPPPSTGSSETP